MQNEEIEQMEMPTPCEHCGEIFDLNDGYPSEKWHENITICEKCHNEEELEIEEDGRWDNINTDVSNALYELKEEGSWLKLTPENQKLIQQIVKFETELDIESIKKKAEKWDKLEEKITACYGHEDENGEWVDNDEGDGLITIGEVAARAFGFLN